MEEKATACPWEILSPCFNLGFWPAITWLKKQPPDSRTFLEKVPTSALNLQASIHRVANVHVRPSWCSHKNALARLVLLNLDMPCSVDIPGRLAHF